MVGEEDVGIRSGGGSRRVNLEIPNSMITLGEEFKRYTSNSSSKGITIPLSIQPCGHPVVTRMLTAKI